MSADLKVLTRPQLEKVAGQMKRKMQSRKSNASGKTEKIMNLLIAAGTGAGLGYLIGGKQHDYDQKVGDDGKLPEGESDPRSIVGVPIELAVGIGAGLLTFTKVGKGKAGAVLDPLAGAAIACGSYRMAFDKGEKSAAEAG